MNRRERLLYHQIHPAKLVADWAFGILSVVPFWNHQLILGVIFAFVPSIVASHFVMNYVDLHKYKNTALGRYVARYIGSWLPAIRLIGLFFIIMGAWSHDPLVMLFGLALILLGWLNGFFATQLRRMLTIHRTPTAPHNLPR